MKVLIDGEKVITLNDVKIIYNDVVIGEDDATGDDILGNFCLTLNDEGLTMDVLDGGEIQTCSREVRQLLEEYF
jgi:hypothetical protein